MKKDPPCSVTEELVNYYKFSILEREKQLFNVHAIIQNGRLVSCVVLFGLKIKAHAE